MPQVVSGVDVTLSVEQGLSPQGIFGRGLCLENVSNAITTEDDVALKRSVRVYSSASAVREGRESLEVQEAATVWFSGDIEPQRFVVGTQFLTAQPILIFGDEFVVSDVEALGDDYDITMGDYTIDDADFDTLTTAETVATALQTAINANASISGATVSVIDGNRLAIVLPGTLTDSVRFDATAEALGLTGDGVTYYDGVSAETATAALTRIASLDSNFTYIHLPTNAYNDANTETAVARIRSIAAWAETNDRIFDFAVAGDASLIANESTSILATQSALTQRNTAGTHTGATIGLLPVGQQAVMSAVRWNRARTARNVANRRIPGVTPVIYTDAQAEELDRKRVNYYRREGNLQHTRGGRTFGEWYEAAVFLLWLKNEISLVAYNYLQSLEAFTASDEDYAGLRAFITVPLTQSIASGFLLPGTVSSAVRNEIRQVTGDETFDGVLREGFLVWNAPASTSTTAQLNNRESLPVYFWAKGAPLINSINISGNYAR